MTKAKARPVYGLFGWYKIDGVRSTYLHARIGRADIIPNGEFALACGEISPWNKYIRGDGYGTPMDRCPECIDHLSALDIV